jgi:hypothetical protein
MKKHAALFVCLDVHKESISVACVPDSFVTHVPGLTCYLGPRPFT